MEGGLAPRLEGGRTPQSCVPPRPLDGGGAFDGIAVDDEEEGEEDELDDEKGETKDDAEASEFGPETVTSAHIALSGKPWEPDTP